MLLLLLTILSSVRKFADQILLMTRPLSQRIAYQELLFTVILPFRKCSNKTHRLPSDFYNSCFLQRYPKGDVKMRTERRVIPVCFVKSSTRVSKLFLQRQKCFLGRDKDWPHSILYVAGEYSFKIQVYNRVSGIYLYPRIVYHLLHSKPVLRVCSQKSSDQIFC